MTRTAAAPTLRRKLALTTALGMSLGVFVTPAAAQVQGSFGTVTGTSTNDIQIATPTPTPATVQAPQPTFQVTAETTTAGERLDVDLNARTTVIEWSSLNVPAATLTKTLSFNNGLLYSDGLGGGAATDAKAVLNRVTGATATEISGIVTTGTRNADLSVTNGAGNISVWIVNGSGIMVGAGANINTGGLVLSALNIDATNTEAFRATTAGSNYAVNFANAIGSTSAITTTAGAATQITTTNGVLALIAPQIVTTSNVTTSNTATGGSGKVAYVLASDVNFSTRPGGPLSITVNAGTQVDTGQNLAGAIVGDAVYVLLQPDDTYNTLLNVTGTVSNATVNAKGVVVLAGGGLSGGIGTDTLTTSSTSDASTARTNLGAVTFATGTTAPTTGTVAVTTTGALGGSSINTAGNIAIAGKGDVTLSGTLTTATGNLTLDRTLGTTEIGALAIGGNATIGATNAPSSFEVTGTSSAANLTATGGALTFGGLISTTGRTQLTGVQQIGTTGAVQTAGITAGTDTAAANRDVIVAGKTVNLGLVQAGTTATLSATGTVAGNRDITVAGVQAGGDVSISSDASAKTTVTAGVNVTGGNYSATGGTVAINAGTQQASGTVTLAATGGTVTVASGITVQAGAAGNALLIGGDGTTGLALGGSTLKTTAATGAVLFTTATAGDSFVIGGVQTSGVSGRAAAATTANQITRTGVVGFGDVTLTGTAATTIDATGSTDALDLQAISTSNALTLKGGIGGVSFTSFGGTGNKVVTSGAGISGTSLAGTGTVDLTAAAGSPISITGTIGTDSGNRLGALTVNGSNGVTFGTTGATGTTAFLTSASIGQGTNVGSLTINGGTDHSGTFTSTSTNATTLGDVASGAALNVTANNGGVGAGALTGAGTKTIVANGLLGTIGIDRIRGAGAVTLTGAAAPNGITVTNGIGASGAAVASLDLNGGNATLGAVYVTGAAQLGQGAGLSSLTQNGLVEAGSLLVTTAGAQSFNSTVTTTAQTVLVSNNGLVTTTGLVNAGTSAAAANRSLSITGKSVGAGTLQAGSSIAVTGNGTLPGNRNVTVAGADAGTSVTIAADISATTTVSGTVTARGGGYLVSGGTVSLTGGTQQATGATTVNGGVVNASAGVVVRSNSDNAGGELLTVGNATTTAFQLTGSTLQANGDGTGTVRFASATDATPFAIGNVTAATVEQQIAAGAPGAVNRTGNISFGDLALSGANTIGASGSLQTGGIAAGNGALTFNAGTAASVTGTIANLAGGTGGVTVNGATLSVGGSALTGALVLNATSATPGQGVTYTTLGGSGSKTLNAAQAIGGGAIGGAGAVTLNPGAAGTVSITGDIGVSPSDRVASLTVTRGGIVGLQGAYVTGATTLGQASAIGALTVAGTLDTGSLLSDSTGASSFQAVRARAGAIDVGSVGAITFGGLVDGTGALIVQAGVGPGLGMTFNAAVGSLQPFASFTSNGGATVTLKGGSLATVTTPGGTQSYGGPLVLGADTVLTGAGATFTGGIQGNDGVRDHDLALNFSQAQTLPGTGLSGVRNLSTDAAGSTMINGNITTSGSQTYGDPVTLGASVMLASSGNGTIGFAGLTGGGFGLTVNTGGATTFNNGASLGSITTDAAGSTVLNGTMSTTGGQSYGDDVVLGSATTVQSTGGGALSFGRTVSGAQALTVNTSGLTSFGGAVGTLASLTSAGSGAVFVGGGSVATTGNQSYAGQVRLGANTVLSTTAAGTTVSFGAAGVNGLNAGTNYDLTINTPGAQALNGAITGVRNLTTDAAGTLSLAGGITTTGAQSYGENVTLTGATTLTAGTTIGFGGSVDGAQTLSTNAAQTTFAGDVGTGTALTSLNVAGIAATSGTGPRRITTSGTQTYGGQLALGVDTILIGTGATFTGGVNGSASHYGLTLTFSAANSLGANPFANVGDLLVNGAGTTTLNGNVTTVGSQTWASAIGVAAAATLASTGNAGITLNTVGGNSALTIATGGATSLNGAIGGITALTTDAGGTTTINTAAVTTTAGKQTYGDNVVLGVNTTLTANGAAPASGIVFNGTLTGARTLATSSPGGTAFNGIVGATLAGGAPDTGVSPVSIGVTGPATIGTAAVTTATTQTYGGPVTLAANTVLTGTTVGFGGTVAGGGFDLTLDTSGAQVLSGGIGGVRNLTTDAAGTLSLSGTIGTTGNQRYGEAVTLADATTLNAGGAIGFANTVNGAQALTTSATQTNFNADVGGGTALTSLQVTGIAATAGAGPRTIRTTGAQTYNGVLALGADTVLVGSTGSLAGGVNGSVNNYNLTLTFAGANTLNANPFTNVGNLLVNGAGTTTTGGNVTTVGSQTWTSALNIGAATVLASSGNAAITLNSVGGSNALTVTAAGATSLNGAIGGITALTTDGGGTTTINAAAITTTAGRQSYGDNLVLGVDTVLTANGTAAASGFTFGGSVTGPKSLTLTSAGQATFNGVVGGTTGGAIDPAVSPTALVSNGSGIVRLNGGAITTNGVQSYTGVVQLGADTVLRGTTGTFTSGIAGNGFDLRLIFANPVAISGSSGGFDDLLVDNAALLSGTIVANTQTYNGAVTLAGDTTLRSGSTGTGTGAIVFGSTVDAQAAGGQGLTVTTGGTTSFTTVGGARALAALTVNGTGPVTLNGSGVTTTGAQRYTGATTLTANQLLTTNGGDIAFASTVSGPFRLSVRTIPTGTPVAGTASFGGAVSVDGLAIRANAATAAAVNQVGTLAANVRTGGLAFTDGGALTIGTVDGLAGVSTNTGAATITAGGLLTVANSVSATGATLTGTGLTQNSGTTIGGGTGAVVLDGNDGAITLAGLVTTANAGAGAVLVRDAAGVQLGNVVTGGTLTLGGAGGDDLSGAVTQLAGTTLNVGAVAGNVGGAATLTNANAIGAVGAFAATGLALHTTSGLTVTGPVDARGGDLTLTVDGAPLALQGNLSTGGTATFTVGGAITQTAGSVVTASTLTGSATGAVALTGANQIANLGAFGVTAGGLQLVDVRALTVTADQNVTGNLALTAIGLDFTGRTLAASGTATLNAQAGALTGTTVTAAGVTTISGGATTLGTVTGNGDVSITGGSAAVGTAAATNGALGITSTAGPLSLGTGTAGTTATLGAAGTLDVTGSLTSGGAASLIGTGAVTVASVESTGASVLVRGASATVPFARSRTGLTVQATAGDVSLTNGVTTGTGGNALVSATGNVALGSLGTTAAPIQGSATVTAGGTITGTSVVSIGAAALTAGGALQIGTLQGAGASATGQSVNVTTATATGALLLQATGGTLTLDTGSASGTADLLATGDIAVATGLTSGATATLTSNTGAVRVPQVTATGGDIVITAATGVSGGGAARAALTANGSDGDVRVTTGGQALLGPVGSTLTASVQAASIDLSAVSTGGLTLTSTGDTLLGTGTVGAALLTVGGNLGVTTLTATGGVSGTVGGAATIGAVSGSDIGLVAGSAAIGSATATSGALALRTTGGSLSLGTGAAGTTATLQSAGTLNVGNALVTGNNGAANGSVTTTSAGASTIASVRSKTGAVSVTGVSADVGTANAAGALLIRGTAGNVTLGTGSAGGAATLDAVGAGSALGVTTGLTAGSATLTAGGAATVRQVTTSGAIGLQAVSADVTGASAGTTLALTTTGGALALGTGTSGGAATLTAAGPLTVTNSLVSGGSATGTATGAATIGTFTANGGAAAVTGQGVAVTTARGATTLDLTATGGSVTLGSGTAANGAATLKATGGVTTTALTATGAATITAGAAATLGTTSSSAGAVTVTGATITAGQTAAATTLSLTSTGNLSLSGNSTTGSAATIDAGGTASLGQLIASGTGATITVKALDAAITGTLRAGTVTFVNRTPASNVFKLGNGTSTGGFALSSDEVNNVEAGQLTIDGGSGNVEIGALAFDADAGRTRVDILSTGRIDVSGTMTGTGSGRTFRLGGSAAAGDKAAVIRVVATASAGGRLLFDGADLDLRGARIGVGQAAGFLDPIGFAPGATPLSAGAVAGAYIANPNSSLYNATFGGSAYTDPTSSLISARSLTVRYTDYALFQNTGAPGTNLGAALGSAASPSTPALVIQGSGGGNAFALFGRINGIGDTGAALTGSSVLQVSGADLANTRVNGCLAGSGAGCLTAVVSQPLLNIFDSSRLAVFRAGDDLALPFDPVVGTNNEALFSGFGLIDSPVTDTECSADTTSPGCAQNKEQGK